MYEVSVYYLFCLSLRGLLSIWFLPSFSFSYSLPPSPPPFFPFLPDLSELLLPFLPKHRNPTDDTKYRLRPPIYLSIIWLCSISNLEVFKLRLLRFSRTREETVYDYKTKEVGKRGYFRFLKCNTRDSRIRCSDTTNCILNTRSGLYKVSKQVNKLVINNIRRTVREKKRNP